MEDKIYAPDFEAFLKKYSENRNYYEPDLLYDVIIKAEQKFVQNLNEQQRNDFSELRKLYDRYIFLIQQQEFSKGFFVAVDAEQNGIIEPEKKSSDLYVRRYIFNLKTQKANQDIFS